MHSINNEIITNENYIEDTKQEVIDSIIKFYKENETIIENCYNDAKETNDLYIEIEDDTEYCNALINTSVVILTANEYEKNILHKKASKNGKIFHYQINCTKNDRYPLNINVYLFKIENFDILHLEAVQTGSYTIGGSADLVRYVVENEFIFPTCIISFGICFGNDHNTQNIGDTIVAKKVYPYFISAKVNEIGLTVTDNNIFEINNQLSTRLRFLKEKGFFESCKMKYGNIITGEAVINNAIIKEIFTRAATNQPVLGGEMEGYGVFKECQGFKHSIPCMVIKAICDWGVVKNIDDKTGANIELKNIKDKLQAYAANCAYKVLSKMFLPNASLFRDSVLYCVSKKIQNKKENNSHSLNSDMWENIKNEVLAEFNKKISYDCSELLLSILQKKQIIKEKNNSNIYKIL